MSVQFLFHFFFLFFECFFSQHFLRFLSTTNSGNLYAHGICVICVAHLWILVAPFRRFILNLLSRIGLVFGYNFWGLVNCEYLYKICEYFFMIRSYEFLELYYYLRDKGCPFKKYKHFYLENYNFIMSSKHSKVKNECSDILLLSIAK